MTEDFNANTIAVAGSRQVCGDPVMTTSPSIASYVNFMLRSQPRHRNSVTSSLTCFINKCTLPGAWEPRTLLNTVS